MGKVCEGDGSERPCRFGAGGICTRPSFKPQQNSRKGCTSMDLSREFADTALSRLNSSENVDFELVEPGVHQATCISRGIIFHTNFTAKRKADPGDELQTFFAQIRHMFIGGRMYQRERIVDCCVNLGPTHLLPERAYLSGCQYCSSSVHHPIGGCGKLLLGCSNDDSKWLYNSKSDSDSDSDSDSGSELASGENLEHSGGCTGPCSDADV